MSENEQKQQLELVVSDDFKSAIPTEIPCNIEAIIKRLDEEILPKYRDRVYLNNQLSEARADHATLKKWIDNVDETRKAYEKIYMKPFKDFKAKLKLAIDCVMEVADEINEQIFKIENDAKEKNRDFCRGYFDSVVGALCGYINFENIEDQKWYNLSTKDNDRKKAIDEKLSKIKADLAVIERLDAQDKQAIKAYYLWDGGFDLSKAIMFHDHIKENRERIVLLERQNLTVADNLCEGRNSRPNTKSSDDGETDVFYTIRFRVDATEEQLVQLKAFLDENGIEYNEID